MAKNKSQPNADPQDEPEINIVDRRSSILDKEEVEEAIEELESELKQEFGTADPQQLQLLLTERTAANNDKCQKYELHLNEVKQKLADLKQEIKNDENEVPENDA